MPGRELRHPLRHGFPHPAEQAGGGDDEARAAPKGTLTAKGKHVVVIGGGDTGLDCVGTSNRQGAASVTQLEVMPQPPERENKALTWPDWPLKMRTSSSHEEGVGRDFAVLTKRAVGKDGKITALECARIEWVKGADGRMAMKEVAGSAFELKADLVLLAMGFLGLRRPGMVEQSGVTLDPRGNIAANVQDYRTSVPKLFAAGDMRRGQSLVVWAIREGRQCARSIDEGLMGTTTLPRQRFAERCRMVMAAMVGDSRHYPHDTFSFDENCSTVHPASVAGAWGGPAASYWGVDEAAADPGRQHGVSGPPPT